VIAIEVTVASILETVDRVDLIDAASVEVLGQKVRRLHIGTPSADVEVQIRATLSSTGWQPYWYLPCETEMRTPYGRVSFEDGVQAWRNPRL
jgi:hypothetical protein